ncbi:methyltransferase domain-containing protein [archaeon]|nr:methyltransferase domain-containing protein [archaeon]MBL7056800.1 methyltransferase domain-containing protein [Candidatus Woesearchaeota archaeon]
MATKKTTYEVKHLYDEEYFSKHKKGYQNLSQVYKFRLSHIFNVLGPVEGNKVLDLGCGMGTLSFECAKKGADVYGLDYAESAIKNAKEIGNKLGLNINFKVGDSAKMPYKDDFFDKIICADFTEHLDIETLRKSLKECYRVLKPRGKIILFTPSPTHIIERLKKRNWILKEDPAHIGLMRMKYLKFFIREAGFRIKMSMHLPTHFYFINMLEEILISMPFIGSFFRRRISILAIK